MTKVKSGLKPIELLQRDEQAYGGNGHQAKRYLGAMRRIDPRNPFVFMPKKPEIQIDGSGD